MEFSISEVAEKMNVTVPTLIYYDNIGLFKNLKKNKAGNRVFTEEEVEALRVIQYLKKSGMQLTEIKEFMNWCKDGDSTLENRLNLFKKQKENKELMIIPDAVHTDLYDNLEVIPFDKMENFFKANLK